MFCRHGAAQSEITPPANKKRACNFVATANIIGGIYKASPNITANKLTAKYQQGLGNKENTTKKATTLLGPKPACRHVGSNQPKNVGGVVYKPRDVTARAQH